MSETPPPGLPVDPPRTGAQVVEIGRDGQVWSLVVVAGDPPRAFLNRCPHARWPLDTFDGRILRTDAGALVCAAHGAVFDARDGACLGGPGTGAGLTPVALRETGWGWETG